MSHALIGRIHQAGRPAVLVVTGGGATAIGELLSVPGGSRSLLEARVPYASPALVDWLGAPPEQYCSEETALAMAVVAYQRAQTLLGKESSAGQPLGISATASLASERPKRGGHRAFVAVQSAKSTASYSLELDKGKRTRRDEEKLVCDFILQAWGRGCRLLEKPSLELTPADHLEIVEEIAGEALSELFAGSCGLLWSLPSGDMLSAHERPAGGAIPAAGGVLCGAFNPLHAGHEQLRTIAEARLGRPVHYELSIRNVDKPPLDYVTIARRRRQFGRAPLALTNAPTFAEKARLLPGVVFVVGYDTAERIIDPKYYGNSADARDLAMQTIRARSCRFLVAGRECGGRFFTLEDLNIPPSAADLFQAIPREEFRADISSTHIRARAEKNQE